MIGALRALGAIITEVPGSGAVPDLVVTPIPVVDGHLGDVTIDCGLAGTVMR